ncbi:ATP-dependent DNA helicase RecQ [Nymphon striatum]|nr:ATP-dependent DNA helicase RecQ [Nymphon striatum]
MLLLDVVWFFIIAHVIMSWLINFQVLNLHQQLVAQIWFPHMTSAATLLRDVFGFDAFRPGQEDIVDAVTAGENVLAIMPTGGGKSLCFQLPAMLRDGVTVVISPLIALMRDQVRGLREAGVAAGALTSGNYPRRNRRSLGPARARHAKTVVYRARTSGRRICDGHVATHQCHNDRRRRGPLR